MNRRWRQAVLLAITLGCPAALVRAADLPPAVRTAQSATSQKAAIDKYVKDQIKLIQGRGKPAGTARDELARQPESNVVVQPSASFQSEYVTAVVANIGVLLNDKSDKALPDRLNAAIVVYRLANATRQTQLDKLTQDCLADPAAAVSLWGIKSAGALLPESLRLQLNRKKGEQLAKAVVDAAKRHHTAGAVVQTAYDALYLPDQGAPQLPLDAAAHVPAIDAMNQLLAFRVLDYVAGLPPQVQAERVASGFFNRQVIVGLLDKEPARRAETMQNLLNVLSVAVQHTATAPALSPERGQVVALAANYAELLKVRLLTLAPAASAKFDAVAKMKDPNYPTADAIKAVGDGMAALKATTFTTLKDAPTIKAP